MDPADEVVARRIGQKLGDRWTLERLLGTGGMAAVYAAHDDAGAIFAIKILHPEMSLRSDVRERFLREAYVANKIGHPGAVAVLEHYDGGEQQAYLVMPLLEGEPLSDRVRRGALPVAELFDYLDQVLDVLVRAHDQGIVHRDLKPDNLFVTRDGQVKILDFGVARLLHDAPGAHKTRTGMALGTLPYMAPEQALGRREEIDGRVDLFSIGATAFRILAGRKVHEADSDAELLIAMASKPAPPLASVLPSAPADVCAVVDLALAFSREARYPDARTMQKDVRAVRRGEPPPFASRRLSAREQSTRLDMPAVAVPAAAAVAPPAGAQRTPTVVAPQRAAGEPPPSAATPSAAPIQRTPTVAAAPNAAVQRTPTVVAPKGAVQRTPTVVAGTPGEPHAPVSAPGAALSAPASERAQPLSAPGTFVPTHVTAPGAAQAAPAPSGKKSSKPLLIAAGVLAIAALGGAAALAFGGDSTEDGSTSTEGAATSEPTSEAPGATDEARATTGSTATGHVAPPSTAPPATTSASATPPPPADKRGKGHGRGKSKH